MLIALALFVVADVFLVWAAMSAARTPPPPTSTDRVAMPSAPATPAPATAEPAVPAEAPAAPADFDVARPVALLAAYDSLTAYRAITGECPVAPPEIEVTTDGGVSWDVVGVTDASAVEAITPEGANTLSVIARDGGDCEPGVYRSFVQGAGWAEADELGDRWRLDEGAVVAPGEGSVENPCASPVQVAGVSPVRAAVLCADAVVQVTDDAGATWTPAGPISGIAAIAARPDAVLVALERQNGCDGLQVATLDASLTLGEAGACITTQPTDGHTAVAVSNDGAMVWLWSGGVVARSVDGGQSW